MTMRLCDLNASRSLCKALKPIYLAYFIDILDKHRFCNSLFQKQNVIVSVKFNYVYYIFSATISNTAQTV